MSRDRVVHFSKPQNADLRDDFEQSMANADVSPLTNQPFSTHNREDDLEEGSITSTTSITLKPFRKDKHDPPDESERETLPYHSPPDDWHRLNEHRERHLNPSPILHSSPYDNPSERMQAHAAESHPNPLSSERYRDIPLDSSMNDGTDNFATPRRRYFESPERQRMEDRIQELNDQLTSVLHRQTLNLTGTRAPVYTVSPPTQATNNDVPNSFCPEPFKGTDREDAPVWFRRYEMYVTLKNWSPQQAARAIPMLFRESAASWYDSLSPEIRLSFPSLKQAFQQRYFPHPAMRWSQLESFNERKQLPQESVDMYVQTMQHKGNELKKGSQEIMETICRGFKDHIRHFVIEREPKSLDQAIHLAKLAESIKKPSQTHDKADLAVLSAQIDSLSKSFSVALTSLQASQANQQPPPQAQRQIRPPQGPRSVNQFNRQIPQAHEYTPRQPFVRQGQYNRPQGPPPHERQGRYNAYQGQQPRQNSNQNFQRRADLPNYNQPTRRCVRCAGYGHMQSECRFLTAQCHNCGAIGHIARVCQQGRI